jgi:preprotein translocase subunit SecG
MTIVLAVVFVAVFIFLPAYLMVRHDTDVVERAHHIH